MQEQMADCRTPWGQPTAEQKAPAPKEPAQPGGEMRAHPSGKFATCRSQSGACGHFPACFVGLTLKALQGQLSARRKPWLWHITGKRGQLSARPEPWTREYSRGDAFLSAAVAAGTAVCCHQAHSAAHAYVWPMMSATSSAALNMVMPYVNCTAQKCLRHLNIFAGIYIQNRQ